ncbi:MAG: hypothetical protein NVSMB49_25760 [Ktedonobacteraceae bacterium]
MAIRVFVIAVVPMQQAGLRMLLTSSELEIMGELLIPDGARKNYWKLQTNFSL